MLPPYIIDQIRKREESEQHRYEQPVAELPLPSRRPVPAPEVTDDAPQRGVIVIDLMG
ncbi:MAG: hypothetical protein IT379_35765 [Deltaproteobacteria bacterium]|nr:hypothetical protein [Deltaproteobacteria bacterium]